MNSRRSEYARINVAAVRRSHLNVGMVLALAVVLSAAMVTTASARKREDSGRGGRIVPGGYGRVIRLDRSAPVLPDSKRLTLLARKAW